MQKCRFKKPKSKSLTRKIDLSALRSCALERERGNRAIHPPPTWKISIFCQIALGGSAFSARLFGVRQLILLIDPRIRNLRRCRVFVKRHQGML
eukprot:UN05156